jgi:beta-N-acetylhexosaminidase
VPGEEARIVRTIREMTLREKVGQLFVPYVYGQTADTQDPAMVAQNRRLHGVDNADGLVDHYRPGGVILFARSGNVESPRAIARLSNGIQRAAMRQRAPIPLLISTDQEHGVVCRVPEPATHFPGSMAIGATRSVRHARTAARISGEELRAMGINQNLAPVADVNSRAANPVIGVRSFGEDPSLVSELSAAQVLGYQGANLSSTAKHFPGHGDTAVDSHAGLPSINEDVATLWREDVPPFEAAIRAGVDAIMTAHIVVPALDPSGRPATLSEPVLTGLLRERMGFGGLIVTDSLIMAGVRGMYPDDRVPVEAIKAGADVLLMPPDLPAAYEGVLAAVRCGELTERRIDESVARILEVKLRRGLFENPYVDEAAVEVCAGGREHVAAAQEIARDSITLVKDDAGALPLSPAGGGKVLVTGWGARTTGRLARRLAARGAGGERVETGANPTAARRAPAVAAAARNDVVVVTTHNSPLHAGQRELVKSLLATGKPVIVAAVGNPYDISGFPHAPTYIATYSYSAASMEALAGALFGEYSPSGRLPVTIAGADGATLYPYGHGLGYDS